MSKPSGEKTRKDLVIIGKVLFSSDLLFSKDYILLLKITLKWLLITQGKYVPLLIHLLAMYLLTVSRLRSIRDILFEKVCENIAKKLLPRPFRPWLILTTIFFPMLTPQYHILKYVIVIYLIRKAKLTLLVPKYTSLRACSKFVPIVSLKPPYYNEVRTHDVSGRLLCQFWWPPFTLLSGSSLTFTRRYECVHS